MLIRYCILLIFCFVSPYASAQYAAFRNYLTEEETGSSTVYCAFPDTKGFVWFATEYGVIRFDGKNYQKFTVTQGLSDNEVLRIHEDSKGRIWFLTLNGRLSFYYNGVIYNEHNNKVLKRAGATSTLSAFHEDRHGNLWFGGYHNQVLRISAKNEIKRYNFKGKPLGENFFFFEGRNGEVLLASQYGFYRLATNSNLYPVKAAYLPTGLKAYYHSNQNYLLFLAREGLVEMKDTVQRILVSQDKMPQTSNLSYIYKDAEQKIWLTTLGNGVYCFNNLKNKTGSLQHFLPGKVITWCTQDQEKNMWFSTVGNGVYMLPANRDNLISYTKEDGLTSDKIYSVSKDKQNHIWVGLHNGQVNEITPTGIKQHNLTDQNQAYNRVTDIYIDKVNSIWCATDAGLVKIEPSLTYKDSEPGIIYPRNTSHFAIKSIARSKNNHLTFVHSNGMESLKTGGTQTTSLDVKPVPGVDRTRIFNHFYDRNGTLWYATINGLQQYLDSSHIINHGQKHFLLSRRITDINELKDGTLVIGTYGYGVILFKDGKIRQHLTKQNGLAEDICKKVVVQDSVIWVATNDGLTKMTLRDNRVMNSFSFRTADGLLSNDIQDIYVDTSGVYIATFKGLSVLVDPVKRSASQTPPVYLTSIKAGKKGITNQLNPDLKYYENQFIVSFIGVTFQDPQNVLYLYRLKGINNYWTTTTNNTIEFSALTPGSYVFEVRAKKLDSGWSSPISYSFRILPPFWKTWWFITFAVIMLSLLVILGIQYILSLKLKKQLQRLEMEHKIQLERERIARDLHDNVGSHLTYIVNSLDDTPPVYEPGEQQIHIEHLRNFTKQTITQLRETIWAIRKEKTSVGELKDQLQKMLKQTVSPQLPMLYHFKHDINETLVLTPVQALNIFRITQEAVTNILKHSQTTVFMVALTTYQNETLHLVIQDEGVGFDLNGKRLDENYGLQNIRDRATEIAAVLELESTIGKGTRLSLELKLTEKIPYTSDVINKLKEQIAASANR